MKNKLVIEPIKTIASVEPRYYGDRDEVVTTPSETIDLLCVISSCKYCVFVLYMVNHI